MYWRENPYNVNECALREFIDRYHFPGSNFNHVTLRALLGI
ncbi:hypothetical protein [Thermococcus sp.]|nr:hypothetical protein [Thermococcus sp.]